MAAVVPADVRKQVFAVRRHPVVQVVRQHVRIDGTLGIIVTVEPDRGVDGLDAREVDNPLHAGAGHGIVGVVLGIERDELVADDSFQGGGRKDAGPVAHRHDTVLVDGEGSVIDRDRVALDGVGAGIVIGEAVVQFDFAVRADGLGIVTREGDAGSAQVHIDTHFSLMVALPDQVGVVRNHPRHQIVSLIDRVVRRCGAAEDLHVGVAGSREQDREGRLLGSDAPTGPEGQFLEETIPMALRGEDRPLRVEAGRDAGSNAVGRSGDDGVVIAEAGDEIQVGIVRETVHEVVLDVRREVGHRGDVAIAVLAPGRSGLGLLGPGADTEVLVGRPLGAHLDFVVDLADVLGPVGLEGDTEVQGTVVMGHRVVPDTGAQHDGEVLTTVNPGSAHVVSLFRGVHADAADGLGVTAAAAGTLVAVDGGSHQFDIGDPLLAEQPVGGNVAAEGIVLTRREGLQHTVRIGLVIIAAQVAGDAGGEAQGLVGEESLGELPAVVQGQLLTVVRGERRHLVADGAGVLQRGVEHAPGDTGTRSAQAEALVQGDLLGQRAGGHGQRPGGLTPLGIDLDDTGRHVTVFHGRDAGDDFHRLHVGRGDVVGRDTGHAREGGVVRKPDTVHLDGRAEGAAAADGESLAVGERRCARLTAGKECADVGHIHDLDMLEGHFVNGSRRRGGVRILLGRHDGAFQAEVVQEQAETHREVFGHGDFLGHGHVAEA